MLESISSKYLHCKQIDDVTAMLGDLSAQKISAKGLNGSMVSFFLHALQTRVQKPLLLILPEKEDAAFIFNDLQQLRTDKELFFFPASSQRLIQDESQKINQLDRSMVLKQLAGKQINSIVVTYTEAIFEKTVNAEEVISNSIDLKVGEKIGMDDLIHHLNDSKFERTDFVYEPGQFSWRGGIIDVFSFSADKPYRIEFFGDEIEVIKAFDIEDQLSVSDLKRVTITPDLSKVAEGSGKIFSENFPPNTVVCIKDMPIFLDRLKECEERTSDLSEQYDILSVATKDEIIASLDKHTQLEFGNYFNSTESEEIHFNSDMQPSFNKNFELLADNLRSFEQKNYTNYITASDGNQVNRFHEIFEDIGKGMHMEPLVASIHEGFIDHDNKILCYTDHQIFGRYHKFRLRESFDSKSQAISLKELMGLKAGDFITHIDHGVGKFSGLEKIDVNGKKQEAIRILYKNNDVLYISIHSLHRISKYVGKEGSEPKLDKLGSNAWKILKQKTKTRVKVLAFDLIKLYAERKAKEGFAFSPDSYMQIELEASFIYEDTPDQFKATADVKKDMEMPHPMDRLVCGDVGFGKTEIAIRAAFKAVNDSKQVAVLVPTTILAMQHYKTFMGRLEQFPCKIEYLNRFRSAKDEKRILKEVEEGKVDILIGTHKLLSDKIKFKDLGLMVIDEEQKFGVGAKEKLKTFKVNVDTLTLTATPIPRTLQFSMMGARDLSIISTAPPNRLPIETHLYEFNEVIIREAIEYELSRGGQVFFIHNRVQNIGEVGAMIQRLCPGAKTLVAHGQMHGHELEERMLSFIEGEYDVLVSTTIIESGLDISNANTIIINQANNFGLSDLHQMRGRVGRSNRKAFCYLLAPPLSSLTDQARKRLKAIEQFSDLGSGFHIAMRDLDIRGAGDIFGAEQSGFISDMGFDMYQKILKEAIQELKENEFREAFKDTEELDYVSDCQIETDLEILIPDDYVTNVGERLNLYRELDEIENDEGLTRFRNALIDRFGELPEPTEALIETLKLRRKGKALGIEKMILKNETLICYFNSNPEASFYQSAEFREIIQYVQHNSKICKLVEKNDKLSLRFQRVISVRQSLDLLASIRSKAVDLKLN